MAQRNDTANGVEVHDASDLRKYRTEIPNLILEMDLSPYAFALYVHLKRTAGQDGTCWKSTTTLAKECSMSAGSVSGAKQELLDKKLIKVEQPSRRKTAHVTIVDVWPQNFQHFASVQHMNTERSPHETRKEPLEESIGKEDKPSLPANAQNGVMPIGQFGIKELADRVIAARERGAQIHSTTERERKDFGFQFKQADKDGHALDEMLLALDFMVAKAAGEMEDEPKAWCGYRTALDAVLAGWRPDGVTTQQEEEQKQWAIDMAEESERLIREAQEGKTL